MMLKTTVAELNLIQQRERAVRAAQLKDRFHDHKNKPVNLEDHLPFENLRFKLASELSDAPRLSPLVFAIDYEYLIFSTTC